MVREGGHFIQIIGNVVVVDDDDSYKRNGL
jgi:hypothetical protein